MYIMEKLLFVAFCISVLFLIAKFIERKYLKDETPLKYVLRDTAYVMFSSIFMIFILVSFEGSIDSFMNALTGKVELTTNDTQVFTGNPDF